MDNDLPFVRSHNVQYDFVKVKSKITDHSLLFTHHILLIIDHENAKAKVV
jgi:hypothetical protein